MRLLSLVPDAATSMPTARKRIRHLRSQSRCPSGRFSSSTNIEAFERFVLYHQVRNGDGLRNRALGHFSTPLVNHLIPGHAIFKLFEDKPYHDARSFEGRLAAADLCVCDNVPPQLNPVVPAISVRFHANASHYAPAGERLQAVRDSRPLRGLF